MWKNTVSPLCRGLPNRASHLGDDEVKRLGIRRHVHSVEVCPRTQLRCLGTPFTFGLGLVVPVVDEDQDGSCRGGGARQAWFGSSGAPVAAGVDGAVVAEHRGGMFATSSCSRGR